MNGMNDADRDLAELAARQRQVFTRRQAREAGLTFNGIHRRLDRGLFVIAGPATLTFAGVSLDWRGRLQAGLLDLGPPALVAAESAAALLGLDGFVEGPLAFLVPRALRMRRTTGHVISSPFIGALDRCTVDGLPATTGTRTVVDLLGRVGQAELGNAIDSACRLGLTAPHVLRRRLVQMGRQGRVGVTAFDQAMTAAGVQSWLERQFLRVIAGSGLPKPAVQRTYRRAGAHVARVDFDFSPAPTVAEALRVAS